MDGLKLHQGNGQIETASVTDKREREESKEYNLFANPDYLMGLAADRVRDEIDRILEEKGDE